MYANGQINTPEDWFTSGIIHIANSAAQDNSGTNLTNVGQAYVSTVASLGGTIDLNGTTLQNSGTIANNGTINGDVTNGAIDFLNFELGGTNAIRRAESSMIELRKSSATDCDPL